MREQAGAAAEEPATAAVQFVACTGVAGPVLDWGAGHWRESSEEGAGCRREETFIAAIGPTAAAVQEE